MLIDRVATWVSKQIERVGAPLRIVEYGVGVMYSYVLVECGGEEYLGVALTPLEDVAGVRIVPVKRVSSVAEALSLVSSLNPLEKSVGVAAVNAVSSYLLWGAGQDRELHIEVGVDIVSAVPRVASGKVLVVGHMGPLVRALKEHGAREVHVVERCAAMRCRGALSDSALPRLAPEVDTLVVTGATLVNDTLDYILSLRKADSTLILVGPTAGAHPTPLFTEGVNAIASMRAVKVSAVLDVIRRGGGRWAFTEFCEQYVVRAPTTPSTSP